MGHSKGKRRTRSVNEGWDSTIVKAAPSARSARHKKHRRNRVLKIVVGIIVAILVVAGIIAGAVALYVNSLNNSMSLGSATEEIEKALVKAEENKPFYMLIMGIDMREGENVNVEEGQEYGSDGPVKSDTIMLARVDTLNSKVTLLTVPRDTAYEFDDGKIRGVNNVYPREGATGVIDAVKEITGLDVSHYVELSGSDLVTLVDGLGGITVDVPIEFDYNTIHGTAVHLDKGMQHLDGEQALALAGMRILYDDMSDYKRQAAGREVVEGILDAVLTQPAVQIPGVVADAAACVKTDISITEILDMANKMGKNVTVYTGTGPNAGGRDPYLTYDPPLEGHPWSCYVDDEGWERVMDAFTSGEDIGEVSYEGDLVHYAGQPEDTWSRGLVKPKDL